MSRSLSHMYSLDLHIHSIHSSDSILSPEKIIKIAVKKKLSGVAITDHNTLIGADKVKSLAGNNLIVISGSEISTNKGDVIGLFLNEDIRSRDFMEVIDEIKDQGGVSILPHPYKNKLADPVELIRYVDIVEGKNSRTPRKLNEKACRLSERFNKRIVAGSDAHTSFEIGSARTILTNGQALSNSEDIRKCLLYGDLEIKGRESPYHIRMLSAGTGKYKKNGILGLLNASLQKILMR